MRRPCPVGLRCPHSHRRCAAQRDATFAACEVDKTQREREELLSSMNRQIIFHQSLTLRLHGIEPILHYRFITTRLYDPHDRIYYIVCLFIDHESVPVLSPISPHPRIYVHHCSRSTSLVPPFLTVVRCGEVYQFSDTCADFLHILWMASICMITDFVRFSESFCILSPVPSSIALILLVDFVERWQQPQHCWCSSITASRPHNDLII